MSIKKLWKGSRGWVFIGLLFLIVLPLSFNSCGTEYEAPSTTQTSNALISAATLQSWIDAGLVNGTGYDKVIILDVNGLSTYAAGHIPGAHFLDTSNISQSRTEGIAVSNYEVLEGSKMDSLIQTLGIDGNTTIVFTGASLLMPCRAYFTFRYWGFPKDRLKVLDGLNTTWGTTYGLTTTASPAPVPSTYSVKNIGTLGDRFRLSLGEMIDYADGNAPNALAIDIRSAATAGSYAGVRGSTGSNFTGCPSGSSCTDFLVFEGRIRGAQALDYTSQYNTSTYIFNSVSSLTTSFTNIGLNSTKTAYIYCRFGYMGSVTFFVLDGILGWPVAFYDGSWSQWGQLSGNSGPKGQLAPNSPWRTDISSRSDLIVYNFCTISPLTFVGGTGKDDAAVCGSTTVVYNFVIQVDNGTSNPNTFQWSSDGGTTWTSGVAMTTTAQALGATGVTVSFASLTGHTLGNNWSFTTEGTTTYGAVKNVEQLTADGSTCSATYATAGTITNSFGGTTACANAPASYDVDVNRVEEADKAYMGSGGGSGGGGGGGGGAGGGGC